MEKKRRSPSVFGKIFCRDKAVGDIEGEEGPVEDAEIGRFALDSSLIASWSVDDLLLVKRKTDTVASAATAAMDKTRSGWFSKENKFINSLRGNEESIKTDLANYSIIRYFSAPGTELNITFPLTPADAITHPDQHPRYTQSSCRLNFSISPSFSLKTATGPTGIELLR